MPTRSKSSASSWLRLGNDGFEHKIVDNVLWVRSKSAMLGYLNAPSPFDEEGWMNTQDLVEVDGEYIRILGRKSEIINVGGEKVYPQEVEDVILENYPYIVSKNDYFNSGITLYSKIPQKAVPRKKPIYETTHDFENAKWENDSVLDEILCHSF